MKKLEAWFFKYRSYTPIPFLLAMMVYAVPNYWSMAAGLLLAAAGEGMRLWGVSWAGSETRTTGTVGGTFLIVSGPFAHVRNPLYVGNMLMYVGVGIMSFAAFPYLQVGALLFFALQYHLIVNGEEAYLRETFGQAYTEYCKNVPRFFPRLSAYKNPGVTQPPLSLREGLRSERRTLQAFGFVVLTIFTLWLLRRAS